MYECVIKGETEVWEEKNYLSANSWNANPTWICLWLNPDLGDGRSAINRLIEGVSLQCVEMCDILYHASYIG
jgi:hypothetical protein